MLTASHAHPSLSRGHPAKDIRILSATGASAFTDPQAAVEEPEVKAKSPVEKSATETRSPIEPASTVRTKPEAELEHVEPGKPLTEVIEADAEAGSESDVAVRDIDRLSFWLNKGGHGYLPQVGPSPLRFAAPRSWPSPLPEPVDEAAMIEKEPLELPPISVTTAEDAPDKPAASDDRPEDEDDGVADTWLAVTELIAAESSEAKQKLTADLVVGRLDTLLRRGSAAPMRFEPAIIEAPVAEILSDSIR